MFTVNDQCRKCKKSCDSSKYYYSSSSSSHPLLLIYVIIRNVDIFFLGFLVILKLIVINSIHDAMNGKPAMTDMSNLSYLSYKSNKEKKCRSLNWFLLGLNLHNFFNSAHEIKIN
jgi:hypothetical protein